MAETVWTRGYQIRLSRTRDEQEGLLSVNQVGHWDSGIIIVVCRVFITERGHVTDYAYQKCHAWKYFFLQPRYGFLDIQ